MLKSEAHAGFETRSAEPAQVKLSSAGVVTDIIQLRSRSQMDAIEGEHIWTPPLIDMRFNYRPENPLYLLLVRAYRLSAEVMVENTPAYAGCKSWVPLDRAIEAGKSMPVLDENAYSARRENILSAIE